MYLLSQITVDAFFSAKSPLFPYQFLILAVVIIAILLVPLKSVLEAGMGWKSPKNRQRGQRKSAKKTQFSFTERPKETPTLEFRTSVTKPKVNADQEAQRLMPPDGFTPVYPNEDAVGTVTLPPDVIFACIPEARRALSLDRPVRIRLSVVVPQLKRGTIWLLWNQIFKAGENDLCVNDADVSAELRDYWVCIEPKHYVTQVPKEYYAMKKTMPSWLKLPEVPQEQQLPTD